MILVLSFLTLFSLAPTPPAPAPTTTQPDRETVLKACAGEFGPALDRKNNLFEVSRYYVLEAKFDTSGQLTQLGVLPKHWFGDDHPEWNETYDAGVLTVTVYKELLRRLERIQTKGPMEQRARLPVPTEPYSTRRDIYASAVLVTSEDVGARDQVIPNQPRTRTVKYFVVYFTTK